jgi:hypothetical protein
MERICGYCQNPFVPKRTDSVYCSHSCRQLAYVLRKANTNPTLNGLKELKYKPEKGNEVFSKEEASTKKEPQNIYPSIQTEILPKQSEDLTDNEQEPSITKEEATLYPSKNEVGNTFFTENKQEKEIITVNKQSIDKIIPAETKYIDYKSAFIDDLVEIMNEKGYGSKLGALFYHKNVPTAWISLRYKCLLECLLTFSEMQEIDLDDLKEVCNAFTSLIQSRNFTYLPSSFPFINEIIKLRDTIKELCLNEDEDEPLKFRLKRETKLRMIATRWELAQCVPKINFSQLNFTE